MRGPLDTQFDNSSIYYTRYYRSRTEKLPDFTGGPTFQSGQSIGLFLIPADNDTWCLSVLGLAEDSALRSLRRENVFNSVVRRFPDREEWLDGEPLTGVIPFVSAGDMTRDFVLDGSPVATGIAAVGDSRAFTEPRLGRGTIYGVMAAMLLRDAVRQHLGEGPAAMAIGWDDMYRQQIVPWLRAANSAGRSFAKESRTYVAGERPVLDQSNRGLALTQAFESAALVDAELGCWLIDIAGCVVHPSELFARPGLVERIMELGGHEHERQTFGPTRGELLDLLATT